MVKRIMTSGAVAALCIASLVEIAAPPIPRLLYNKSESAPVGWYAVTTNSRIERGVMVAAFAPAEARKLAHDRGYLPYHIPLIKTVWAIAGEEVCSENGVIHARNRPDIFTHQRDGSGRKLPSWQGCIILENNEVFLVSTDVQTSFDSRYFGAVPLENVLGTVRFLGNRLNRHGAAGAQLGRARALSEAKGAEGKIKDGGASSALTPCLHIFFGGAPLAHRSTPVSAVCPVLIGPAGSDFPQLRRNRGDWR